MSTLRIQDDADGRGPRFVVQRVRDGKSTQPVRVASPVGFPVEGRPGNDLVGELRWYLEEFLGYPFSPETEHAERVLAALAAWGRQTFTALFEHLQAAEFLNEAKDGGRFDRLCLQIASDDARVLAWPWEALEDPLSGRLAQTCQVERRLNEVADPPQLDPDLPRDCVNILLVTARPYADDVRFRSISRPLVELIEEHHLPAHVELLRPPSFDALRRHLQEHPNTYHVVHFDGHGGYGAKLPGLAADRHRYQAEGVLVFEDEQGQPEEVTAKQLTDLLREHAIPAVVLNACQSAMLDEHAADPFACVAAALVKSGVRSVVAMAYSLYVSAARQFVPAFYERLFTSGDVAEAVRAGRQQMLAHPDRVCARGAYPLEDWLVPVTYQQDPLDFSFAREAPRATAREPKLPPEAHETENPYGFIGRDGALLCLERALRRKPASILIQGLGGVGKTTLARGFLAWLDRTGGLGHGCLWLNFTDVRSAEFVINWMGEALIGGQFSAADMERRLAALVRVLRENRAIVVWDNFEVARGIVGTSISGNLTEEDQQLLARLLTMLRGGQSKVIITSRSREEWLGHERCWELPIGGLDGDERWEYCEVVLRDLGLSPRRDDPAMIELMELLGGHPLAMRVILPRLKDHCATALAQALKSNLAALDLPEDDVTRKLAATLRFVENSLPAELRPLLIPLSLHEGFVDADYLERMAKQVDGGPTRAMIDRVTQALCAAGLLRGRGQAIFELHPALTGYLRASVAGALDMPSRDAWSRAFVDVTGRLADALAPRPLHEQRVPLFIHGANFHHALTEAERLLVDDGKCALLQALASYAQNTRDFAAAARLFGRLALADRVVGDQEGEAAAYHQLGTIFQEQRDFATAQQWYRESLAISEKQCNEHRAASTYHQLGTIAQEQRDFAAAGQWYRKSLAIKERLRDEHGAANTYHHLGTMAQEQRDFATAEQWYRKSLAIRERLCDEHGAASTYHQLGTIAQEQRNFAAAGQWYRKSLAIKERLHDEHAAASTYHQLGKSAAEQRDFATAGRWYHKSLAISEKLGIEEGAAFTCHQLGRIAQEQRDFAAAEQWYRKSLAISEKLVIEHCTASSYHQLGMIAEEQRDFAAAENWYRESLAITEKQSKERGTAITCGQLGILAGLQQQYEESARWLIKSALAFARCSDQHGVRQGGGNFLVMVKTAPVDIRAKLVAMWRDAGLGEFPEAS
ncbi:MAG: tetratricopeptide repeat protein [Acidobacteria bacterium]|nr:tetratricopeptide repeat protein [Acidobacteriota bacterium]